MFLIIRNQKQLLNDLRTLLFKNSKFLSSNLAIGASVEVERVFNLADVENFAKLTGDFNSIHFDTKEANKQGFQRPIVHGALVNGAVSSVIGTLLPGSGSILLKQELKFPNPLSVGEPFRTKVTIVNLKKRSNQTFYECHYQCLSLKNNKIVLEGMAKILQRP